MFTRIGFVVLLAAILACGAAEANKARRYYADPPIKDCTRINGRWGYYGNIWCTPAEQLRWDRCKLVAGSTPPSRRNGVPS